MKLGSNIQDVYRVHSPDFLLVDQFARISHSGRVKLGSRMCTATAGTARKSVRLKLLATTFASQTTRLSELRRHSSDAMGRLLGKRPTKKFKAQGTGPTKRTPKGEFDGAAGKDVYLVEDIFLYWPKGRHGERQSF